MDVVFIESTLFEKRREELLDDNTYRLLQLSLIQNPKSGDVIQGSGGLRKIRAATKGHGKRGGTRIIYYHLDAKGQIYLLLVYAKNEYGDLSNKQKKQLKKFVEDWKNE